MLYESVPGQVTATSHAGALRAPWRLTHPRPDAHQPRKSLAQLSHFGERAAVPTMDLEPPEGKRPPRRGPLGAAAGRGGGV
jgi:hypothetical protein